MASATIQPAASRARPSTGDFGLRLLELRLGGLPLGDFLGQRDIGATQFGGALRYRGFEGALCLPPLPSPAKAEQRAGGENHVPGPVLVVDPQGIERRDPKIVDDQRRKDDDQQAGPDTEPGADDNGDIERKGERPIGENLKRKARAGGADEQQQRQTIAGENAVGPKFPVHPSLAETGACQPFGTPPANATVGNRHRAFIDFQRNRTACVWGF